MRQEMVIRVMKLIANRASDALLNYMEACYEKNGNLMPKHRAIGELFRERAHPDTDYNKTIAATVMSEEAKMMGRGETYYAGQLVNPTLYNIDRLTVCH